MPGIPKWEYHTLHSVSFSKVTGIEPNWEVHQWDSIARWLEKEANDGWELVHLSDVKQESYHAVMRRQIVGEASA